MTAPMVLNDDLGRTWIGSSSQEVSLFTFWTLEGEATSVSLPDDLTAFQLSSVLSRII